MMIATETMTKISLEEFLQLPETKPANEYFNGEIEQKIMPQGQHSRIQTRLATEINQIAESQKLALAFTELRCTFANRSIVPDIAVFTWSRIPTNPQGRIANKFNTYPDWIIKIFSPEQSTNKVVKKILFCLNQGSKLGWLIDPEDESVMIFIPDKFPQILSNDEILPVLESLKHWELSVNQLFDWLTV